MEGLGGRGHGLVGRLGGRQLRASAGQGGGGGLVRARRLEMET